MSTKITTLPRTDLVMVESQALRLSQAIATYQTWQTSWLIEGLAARGFSDLSASHIAFISALDCADNMASEIARRLNLSRQAIHKTVRELTALGYVETVENPEKRNSKVIQITAHGEQLIAQARHMFSDLDQRLSSEQNVVDIERLIALMTAQSAPQV
jgi:DNA-binding MarR family transcriptional regulator